MAKILSNKQCSGGRPRAFFTLYASRTKRTPTSATVTFTLYTSLQYPTSYLGTGYGLKASVYFGGSWHSWTVKSTSSTWNGDGSHKTTATFTVPANATGSTMSVSLKVAATKSGAPYLNTTKCSSVSVGSVTATYGNLRMSTSGITQAKGTAKLYGLPADVGYTRTVKWYVGGSYKGSTSASSSSSSTSFSVTGLQPYSSYPVVAKVYYADTKLAEKSITIDTPQETGELKLTPKATYITAQVGGMFLNPNYKRSIDFYIKRTTDDEYIRFSTLASQNASCEDDITGLVSNVFYDIKAVIKNGTRALRTLEASALTLKDDSLVPTAKIQGITQPIGKLECTVTWFSDKLVAGTTYELQTKTTGSWATLKTMTSVESPVVVQVAEGNVDTFFRIVSKNEAAAAGVTNISNEYKLYIVDKFVWDIDKVAGTPMVITANEWNRLREYTMLKNEGLPDVVDEWKVVEGNPIVVSDSIGSESSGLSVGFGINGTTTQSPIRHLTAPVITADKVTGGQTAPTRCESVNMLDPSKFTGGTFVEYNGVPCYKYEDGYTYLKTNMVCEPNTQYIITGKGYREVGETKPVYIAVFYTDGTKDYTDVREGSDSNKTIITKAGKSVKSIEGTYSYGLTAYIDLSATRVNKGAEALPFTPYVGDFSGVTLTVKQDDTALATYTPQADGTVLGVQTIDGNMTVLTDTEGVDVDMVIPEPIVNADVSEVTNTDGADRGFVEALSKTYHLSEWDKVFKDTDGIWKTDIQTAHIPSYNGEVITGEYVSSTGELLTGAEVYYRVPSVITPLPQEDAEILDRISTYYPNTVVQTDGGILELTYPIKIATNKNVDIPIVRKGEPITADLYNRMKKGINNVSFVDVPNKKSGDAIRASDVDALRTSINKAK